MSASTITSPVARRTIQHDETTIGLYALLGLFAYIETCIGPTMPFLRDKLDMSYSLTGMHFSAFAVGGVITGSFGDRIVARFGRRRALWFGMAGMCVCGALIVLSPSVAGTLSGAVLLGIIAGLGLMSNQSALSDIHGEGRTVAIAESNVVASCASILGPLAVGGFARAGIGWQWGILAASPAFALLAWRFWRMPVPSAPQATVTSGADGPLPRLFWVYAGVLFAVGSVEWVFAYWGSEFLDTRVGLSADTAATAMSVFFGAMAAGRFVGARLAQRKHGPTLLIWAICCALLGFPIFWLGGSPLISLPGLFIAGLGIANFYPLSIAASVAAAAGMADKATARLNAVGASSLLIVPFVVGAISDSVGMRWGFGIVLPLLGVALVALVRYGRAAPGLDASLSDATAT